MTDTAALAADPQLRRRGRGEAAAGRRPPPARRGRRRRRHGPARRRREPLRAHRGPPLHPRMGTRGVAAAARRRRRRAARPTTSTAACSTPAPASRPKRPPPAPGSADTLAGRRSLLLVDTNEQAARLSRAAARRARPARPGRRGRRAAHLAGHRRRRRRPRPGPVQRLGPRRGRGQPARPDQPRDLPGHRPSATTAASTSPRVLAAGPDGRRWGSGWCCPPPTSPSTSRWPTPPPCTPPRARPSTPPTPWSPRGRRWPRSTSRSPAAATPTPPTSPPSATGRRPRPGPRAPPAAPRPGRRARRPARRPTDPLAARSALAIATESAARGRQRRDRGRAARRRRPARRDRTHRRLARPAHRHRRAHHRAARPDRRRGRRRLPRPGAAPRRAGRPRPPPDPRRRRRRRPADRSEEHHQRALRAHHRRRHPPLRPRRRPRYADWAPRTDNPEWNDYLAALAAAADQRAAELGRAAADDGAGVGRRGARPGPGRPDRARPLGGARRRRRRLPRAARPRRPGRRPRRRAEGRAGRAVRRLPRRLARPRPPGGRPGHPRAVRRPAAHARPRLAARTGVGTPLRRPRARRHPPGRRPPPPDRRPAPRRGRRRHRRRRARPAAPGGGRGRGPGRDPRPSAPTSCRSSTTPAPSGSPTPPSPAPPPRRPRPCSPNATPTTPSPSTVVTAEEWLAAHRAAVADDERTPRRSPRTTSPTMAERRHRSTDVRATPTPADVREIAAAEPRAGQEDVVRVPTADEVSDSVARARTVPRRDRRPRGRPTSTPQTDDRAAELARWHDDDQAADEHAAVDEPRPRVDAQRAEPVTVGPAAARRATVTASGARTLVPPRPPQRRPDALAPPRPVLDQIGPADVELLRGQVLRLDQLLVGADRADGSPATEPATHGAGLVLHHRAGQPPAGHRDPGRVPVRIGRARLGSPLSRSASTHSAPNSARGTRRFPTGTRGEQRLRHLHASQGDTRHRRNPAPEQVDRAARMPDGWLRAQGRAGRGTADRRPMGGACRPSAYHGRSPRQGCCASASLTAASGRP